MQDFRVPPGTLGYLRVPVSVELFSCVQVSCIYTQAECGTGGSSEPLVPVEV